jgi:hypothetical protein
MEPPSSQIGRRTIQNLLEHVSPILIILYIRILVIEIAKLL